ncbi:MAG TPA: metallophosphoesterase [Verrucomicrobiales bacterium]|nr:metallophosphoesterase [Verrucomicrobiales bacterium]HRJ07849.1 metallophosphoesterase family protein [Prosthecobacter sp.]HRK15416.1 metallophosphoesterase family protein [Prosthecobacter sp.]
MKFCIFGDIHANLEALQSVLWDAHEQGCASHVCLGDIVGYAANPAECLETVREMNCPTVRGNHDEGAASTSNLEELNPLAQAALLWTREQLSEEQRQWLRDLKLVRQVRDFTIVHATLDSPGSWGYVTNRFDAMASFSYQFTQVCFYGHTHVPRIFEKDDSVRAARGNEVTLQRGVKYFVNVGSVGQPRDGDWRASYAIYDAQAQTIAIRRVEYDIQTAQDKIRAAGLPSLLAERLALGK